MRTGISINTPVWIGVDEGREAGTVKAILRDLGNGQGFAVVEIDHKLPGIMQTVALDQLTRRDDK